ncbi:MAG: HAMP domain-containing protein [Proteobacteria bacterium]|nr:HAMP domain-containing protein [Pseudomonadota bacterium]MBU1641605.1 HAMP domain-containing protein [Pseudomonadota bacterium]
MKGRLLWKLLLINIVPVIGVVILVIWLAIDHLAAGYFMALMNKYDVSPTDIHQMFIASIHRYLIWASVAALGLAFALSFLLIRRVLRPLSQMTAIAGTMAAGTFSARVDITSADEIGQLGIAFNQMAASLEKLEKLRKTMVADVAHELRTPLTNLRGYLEGLNDGVIEPSAETFQMLQQESLRLVHLVDDLGQLAKADAARAYLNREALSLAELVGQMLSLYQLRLQDKKISVTTDFPAAADRVVADREKLLLAVRNLLENACNYTPVGGSIEISGQRTDEGIKVLVANSGSGISDADLPYIFERFYRADRSRTRPTGGAGIGLAIVKELIEAHGGRVGADSSQSEARIWFVLPA